MIFFYSRKPQIVMFMLWCVGTAAMYAGITGGGSDFFLSYREPVENAPPRIGAMPEPTPPAPQPLTPPAPVPAPSPEESYTIREGDTVDKIARRRHIDPKNIIERNRLANPDFLRPGDALILPPPGDDARTAETADHVRHERRGAQIPPPHSESAAGQTAVHVRHERDMPESPPPGREGQGAPSPGSSAPSPGSSAAAHDSGRMSGPAAGK
jgi:LysM repeat protein